MPRAQLPHAAASFAVAVTGVSPQSMAQNPRTIVLQAPKKRRSMRKTAKVILGLGVHTHRGGVNSHPQGPGGACPSAGGELSPSGTWGCPPIAGGRELSPSGTWGCTPIAGGELSPSGTWGCPPISGRRTLTLRPQMASDVASGGKDSEKSFCFH